MSSLLFYRKGYSPFVHLHASSQNGECSTPIYGISLGIAMYSHPNRPDPQPQSHKMLVFFNSGESDWTPWNLRAQMRSRRFQMPGTGACTGKHCRQESRGLSGWCCRQLASMRREAKRNSGLWAGRGFRGKQPRDLPANRGRFHCVRLAMRPAGAT